MKVSVICSLGSKKYADIGVGSVIQLVPDENNAHDKNAVKACLDGEDVGFVANARSTVLPGSTGATKCKELIMNSKVKSAFALLLEASPYTSETKVTQKRFIASVYFVPNRAASTAEPDKTAKFCVVGTTIKNSGKQKIQSELVKADDSGTKAVIPLTVEREGVPGAFIYRVVREGDATHTPCGEIDKRGAAADLKLLDDWFATHPNVSAETTGELAKNSEGGATGYYISVTFSAVSAAKYNDAIDAAIARCCGQEPDIREKVEYMLSQSFTGETVKHVLKNMRPCLSEDIPTKPERVYRSSRPDMDPVMNDVTVYSLAGNHVRLVGPKGCGKNTLIETMCWLINQPMIRLQGNAELDKLDILGSYQLDNGNTVFELSDTVKALRDGKTVVVDEANLIRADVLGILHSATDGARSILVPGFGLVKLAPTAQVIYTLNEGYAGTADMNNATVDRCVSFVLSPEVSLANILEKYPAADVKVCQQVSDKIRKAVDEGTLSDDAITIRGYIDACEQAGLLSLKRNLIHCVAHKVQDADQRKVVESIILDCVK